ncbi:DUF7352 domain-containing protein [Roseivirga pacifica]|uniref:DUF7352 domain-containing protein n=1 Tax=Roseivirga pacifica TaxID=1267423 RepID=UPI003F498CD8
MAFRANPKAFRELRIFGTGHAMDENFNGVHVGTYQIYGGDLVFHVFDMGWQ